MPLLNARGQIAETFLLPDHPHAMHAALWENGRTTDLGSLGGDSSWAGALNSRGEVVGGSLPAKGHDHAFLWRRGKMTDLGALRGNTSEALALDNRDQVVGIWGRFGVGHSRAFLWQNGKIADLGRVSDDLSLPIAINDRGQVIRSRQGFLGANIGVLWQQGKTVDLGGLGGGQTWPLAINARGQVVGTSAVRGSTLSDPRLRAFLWEDGKMTALPGRVNYFAPTMSIDPTGTHVVLGSPGHPGPQILLWTRR